MPPPGGTIYHQTCGSSAGCSLQAAPTAAGARNRNVPASGTACRFVRRRPAGAVFYPPTDPFRDGKARVFNAHTFIDTPAGPSITLLYIDNLPHQTLQQHADFFVDDRPSPFRSSLDHRQRTSHRPTTQPTSSAVAKANSGIVSSLQGPRPLPLSVPTTSPPRPSKRPRVVNDDDDARAPPAEGPVILYEQSPKVIHVRPDEFKALVQRLTGRQQPTGTAAGGDQCQEDAVLHNTTMPSSSSQQDPLVLTLGQQKVVSFLPPLQLEDHHHTPPPELPSPGGAGAGFLLSPGSFLFSPATMQAIQELIS